MKYPTTYLQPGMRGEQVKNLQNYLVSRGYMTQDEMNTGPGIYGPRTTNAVAKLQKDLGVNTGGYAGYWGPRTLKALQSSQPQTQSQSVDYLKLSPVKTPGTGFVDNLRPLDKRRNETFSAWSSRLQKVGIDPNEVIKNFPNKNYVNDINFVRNVFRVPTDIVRSITQKTKPTLTKHTIQKGETLSGIAKQNKTDINTLLKANPQIKNPNLIYAGSTLNIPTQTPQTTTGGTPTSNITPTTGGGEITQTPVNTSTGNNDYQKFLMEQIAQQNEYLKDYINTLKNQPNPVDIYNQYSQKLGLPQQQQQVAGLQKQVLDTEQLLNNLESDINKRISGHLVTEPVRRRYLAVEGKPLRKQLAALVKAERGAKAGYSEARRQLADMLKIYGQEQSREEKLAKLPLEYGYKSLPYLSKAYTYESPSTKSRRQLAALLTKEKALQEAGLGRYSTKSTKTRKTSEISRVRNLLTNFGKRNYVSSGYYNQVKANSSLSPTEFDKRFGYLVNGGKFSLDRDLRDALIAISKGADKKAVRERFIQYHPTKASLFDKAIGKNKKSTQPAIKQ